VPPLQNSLDTSTPSVDSATFVFNSAVVAIDGDLLAGVEFFGFTREANADLSDVLVVP
jgi:hypothetical protein